MWREYARVHKIVSSVCMVELQSVGVTGARFRNYGFFQSVRDMRSLFRWWKVRSLFWTGRRNQRAGWYRLVR